MRKVYSFWDIPSVMYNATKAVVDKKEEAIVWLVNAESIKESVDKLVEGTKVMVEYIERGNKGEKIVSD